ncbi:MAG TPA: SpoIVB peptidase S55 domain-containing protein, partial [Gemmataceae bacterium]|nr:SpoIVB peptidase S55 domain-containing protein [Gemmataceae bacterium]
VKPGMKGLAYTIFAGDKIEPFDIEVIGILPNLMGPKQSIILVQLHGDKAEHTGVVAGMSGSPVYIDGKLVGALSLKFGVFVKEPLAGVTPIEDILSIPTGDSSNTKTLSVRSAAAGNAEAASPASVTDRPHYPLPAKWAQAAGTSGDAYLEPIASPLVFSGVAPATLRQYSGEWAPYGMVAAAGGTAPPASDDAKIVPGDMVSMLLVQGDISMSAACTVTAVTEDRVYACGHPLFGLGASDMPLARGRTLTTLASDFNSTKIVNAGGVIGTLTEDRLTAVMGRIGAAPQMIPVDLTVVTPAGEKQFHSEMISNPKLTPLLMGLVAFNGLTQNTAYGEGSTMKLSGNIDIDGHSPVSLEDMYAPTDQFVPDGTFVASSVQTTFTRIFSNPYEMPKVNKVSLRVESIPDRRIASILNAWSDVSEAQPGDPVTIKVLLRPYRGAPVIRDVPITIPAQATRGSTLRVQVSDADSLNRIPNLVAAQGRLGGLDQLISLLNRERRNNQLYVTLLKPTPTLLVEDKELPDAPLSQINVLDQKRLPGNSALLRESTAGEWSVRMDEIISGSTSVFIKIK